MYEQEDAEKSYEYTQINFNHEEDADDVDTGLNTLSLGEIKEKNNFGFNEVNFGDSAPPKEMKLIQTGAAFDHENDTDDIPEGQEPLGFGQVATV